MGSFKSLKSCATPRWKRRYRHGNRVDTLVDRGVAQVREHRAAASVQATWRMLGDRRTAARLMAAKIFREKGHGLATKIQAGWWGHRYELSKRLKNPRPHIFK